MNRRISTILVCISASLLACKIKPNTDRQFYVVGPTNDIKPLDVDKENKEIVKSYRSTVLISTLLNNKSRKFCSGSVISADGSDDPESIRILTNFHCFAPSTEGSVGKAFFPEACTNTQIFFDVSKTTHAVAIERKCKDGSLIGDREGDIAVFEISDQLPNTHKPLKLWDDELIPADRKAYIIHYPDIQENFVSIGDAGFNLPSASVTEEDCRTMGDFTTEEWTLDDALPFGIKHNCDLIHGSSGSALIDRKTNKILGVNWGGIEISYKKHDETVNAATKATYVQAFLDGDIKRIKQTAASMSADAEKKRKEEERKNRLSANALDCGVVALKDNSVSLLALLSGLILPLIFASRKRIEFKSHRPK